MLFEYVCVYRCLIIDPIKVLVKLLNGYFIAIPISLALCSHNWMYCGLLFGSLKTVFVDGAYKVVWSAGFSCIWFFKSWIYFNLFQNPSLHLAQLQPKKHHCQWLVLPLKGDWFPPLLLFLTQDQGLACMPCPGCCWRGPAQKYQYIFS